MDTSDVLLAARDALREHGWRRGMGFSGSEVCLIGSLAYVEVQHQPAYRHLSDFCLTYYGEWRISVVNDELLATEDEACDLLEAAAKWDGTEAPL